MVSVIVAMVVEGKEILVVENKKIEERVKWVRGTEEACHVASTSSNISATLDLLNVHLGQI